MKKLPAFIVTLFLSVMMTPNLVFAVDCNEYGWKNSEDMYQALIVDIVAAHNGGLTFGFRNQYDTEHPKFGPADITGKHYGVALDIQTFNLNFFTTAPYADKWGWLATYLDAVNTNAGKSAATASSANMRFSLAAFFANDQCSEWPQTADYATCGADSKAFFETWGHKYCSAAAEPTCNEYGWKSVEDMYQALAADIYASFNDGTCPGFEFASTFEGVFGAPEVAGVTGPAFDIQKCDLTFFTGENDYAAKWGWLGAYLDAKATEANAVEAGFATIPTAGTANMRYALGAFFANTRCASWPKSADFANCGAANLSAWQVYWGSTFCPMPINEYGWKNKGEMFLDFQKDCNVAIEAAGKYALNVVKKENGRVFYLVNGAWVYWEDVEAANTPVANSGDFAAYSYNKQDEIYSVLRTEKWSWLLDVIKANYKEGREDHEDFDETYAILIRCNIQAFFFNSPTFQGSDNNPWSFDYTEAGKYDNFKSAWGYAFCPIPTNTYGWKSVEDMYQALAADMYASFNDGTCPGFVFASTFEGVFGEPEVAGVTGPAFDIQTCDLTFFTGENDYAAKWGWLGAYLDAKATEANAVEAGFATIPTAGTANMRYALGAFFANTRCASWPKSADFANCGAANLSAWQPTWGLAFDEEEPEEVCNEYGWMTGEEIYQALAADVYAAKQSGLCSGFGFATDFVGHFGAPDVAGNTGIARDISTFDMSFFTVEPYASKWGWLLKCINTRCAIDKTETSGAISVPSMLIDTEQEKNRSTFLRYNLAAFFSNSVRPNWPRTANYAEHGISSDYFLRFWGHQLCPKPLVHYAERAITADRFGTICYPYDAVSIEGAEIYELGELDAANHRIALDPVELPKGGKPYIFYATTTGVLVWAYEEGAEAKDLVENNGMIGTFEEDGLYITEEAYMIKDNAIVKAAVGSHIGQYRAYIDINKIEPQPAAVGRRYIAVPRELTTDLQQLNTRNASFKTIRNGRMVIVREGRMFNALGSEVK